MLPEERKDVSLFTGAARQRVADQLGCNAQQVCGLFRGGCLSDLNSVQASLVTRAAVQVDDCIAKYLWMQSMVQKMAERKRQGLPMPTSITEVEEQLGTYLGSNPFAPFVAHSSLPLGQPPARWQSQSGALDCNHMQGEQSIL